MFPRGYDSSLERYQAPPLFVLAVPSQQPFFQTHVRLQGSSFQEATYACCRCRVQWFCSDENIQKFRCILERAFVLGEVRMTSCVNSKGVRFKDCLRKFSK